MKKKILIVLGLGILVVGGVFMYMYKPHRDIQSEEAAFTITAASIAKEFSDDATIAVDKYLNKTIAVTGTVSEVEEMGITLDNSVYCMFDQKVANIKKGATLNLKGRCIGYDELLELIKIDQSTISE